VTANHEPELLEQTVVVIGCRSGIGLETACSMRIRPHPLDRPKKGGNHEHKQEWHRRGIYRPAK
jgi:hypothetical protein